MLRCQNHAGSGVRLSASSTSFAAVPPVALLILSSTSRLRLSLPTTIWSDFAITRTSKVGSYMGTCGF